MLIRRWQYPSSHASCISHGKLIHLQSGLISCDISQPKEASLNLINSKTLITSYLGTSKVQGLDLAPWGHLDPLPWHFIQISTLEQMPVRISKSFVWPVTEPKEPHYFPFALVLWIHGMVTNEESKEVEIMGLQICWTSHRFLSRTSKTTCIFVYK